MKNIIVCRLNLHNNGIKCGFGQAACAIIDRIIFGIISCIVNGKNIGDVMTLKRSIS